MFRALFAHLQEALHKRYLVFRVRVMSGGCYPGWSGTSFHSNPGSSQLTYHARNIPSAICVVPPDDEQVMLVTCTGHYFLINLIKSASRWFYYPGNTNSVYKKPVTVDCKN
jgi:hypothetical protein